MRRIFIFLLLIPTLTFSQAYKTLSIIELSKKLTGVWAMKTIEKDSLTIEQKIVGGKYSITTKINDRPIKTEYKDILTVLELAFDGYGKSVDKEKDNISVDKNGDISVTSCPPRSSIEYKNGKIIIQTVYFIGEKEEEILELTDNKLILLSDTNMRITYERLK
jgi:hypothetical protein